MSDEQQQRRSTDDTSEFRADERVVIREMIEDWKWRVERNKRVMTLVKHIGAWATAGVALITIAARFWPG